VLRRATRKVYNILLKALPKALPARFLPAADAFVLRLYHECEITIRRRQARKLGPLSVFSGGAEGAMRRQIFDPYPDWRGIRVEEMEIPGMITNEEIQYYKYLGKFYTGAGEVIELGPWLGKSTLHIVKGLLENPNFAGRKLHVFDDFVWRPEWMNQYTPASMHLPRHADFLGLFESYAREHRNDLLVTKCRFAPYDGNELLPPFAWNCGPIEFLFADCGRTLEVNETWYSAVKEKLIPGRSLIVLQDWATHREIPVKPYNQIHFFVGMHASELEIVHELEHGGVAAFLFKG
jgi:hypothetical protein